MTKYTAELKLKRIIQCRKVLVGKRIVKNNKVYILRKGK
jgi:hypothetical protein